MNFAQQRTAGSSKVGGRRSGGYAAYSSTASLQALEVFGSIED